MPLPASLPALTVVHTAVSLIALLAGVLVLRGILASRRPGGAAAFFLAAMAVTDVTGFMFASQRVGPGHIVGALSLVVLVPTVLAATVRNLTGAWRWSYVGGVTALLYLDAVIAILQLFARLPPVRAGGLPVLVATQLAVLAAFAWLGVRAARRFHPATIGPDLVTDRRIDGAVPATPRCRGAFSRRPVVLSPPEPGGLPRQAAQPRGYPP